MPIVRRVCMSFLLSVLLFAPCSPHLMARRDPAEGKAEGHQPAQQHDGQHDFDFELGTWKVHLSRLLHPLTGSTAWTAYEGTSVVRKIWSGRANLVELEVDGPAGHIEGLSLRLYNPQSRQWNISWATSNDGTLGKPMIGEFKNGRGEFFDQESWDGRAIYVRFVFSDITPNSVHFEQSFSDDGGKTWEVNFIETYTRVKPESATTQGGPVLAGTTGLSARVTPGMISSSQASAEHYGQHDFDFVIGTWKSHTSRLQHPLTGSTAWLEYDGISVNRKVWNGRANLAELEADGPAGHLEVLCLRLYNPPSHQWNLNYAHSTEGTLETPVIGEFNNGRGEFYDQESFNGGAIFVRHVWSDIAPDSARFEQAFSNDGGKTWEVNWIEVFTRQK
jgi:hypothetical protein